MNTRTGLQLLLVLSIFGFGYLAGTVSEWFLIGLCGAFLFLSCVRSQVKCPNCGENAYLTPLLKIGNSPVWAYMGFIETDSSECGYQLKKK